MKPQYVYDNYEISPCRRHEEPDSPGRSYFEVCEPAEADVWTLYGHIDGQGVEAIGDFPSSEVAEQVYSRITGQPFTGSYQACSRLRLMHAAPAMLAACQMVVARWEHGDLAEAARTCTDAIGEATTACPPWISGEPDIRALLARHRQIAAIWGVEDVQEIRPDLSPELCWEVLEFVGRKHDAELGISWITLETAAEILFGVAPETDEAEEA